MSQTFEGQSGKQKNVPVVPPSFSSSLALSCLRHLVHTAGVQAESSFTFKLGIFEESAKVEPQCNITSRALGL